MSSVMVPITGNGITQWACTEYAQRSISGAYFVRKQEYPWVEKILDVEADPTLIEGAYLEARDSRKSPARDVATLVTEMKTESGLTADQLGRLLGVSRRTIHSWASGGSIAQHRVERVRALSELILNLEAASPEERRVRLLDSSHGPSLFRQFVDEGTRRERIKFAVPVEEILGL